MVKAKTFRVTYDAAADVLYISHLRAPAVRSLEDEKGAVWRYAEDDQLVGVTLADFADIWIDDQPALASELSRRFGITALQAHGLVARAAVDRKNAS